MAIHLLTRAKLTYCCSSSQRAPSSQPGDLPAILNDRYASSGRLSFGDRLVDIWTAKTEKATSIYAPETIRRRQTPWETILAQPKS